MVCKLLPGHGLTSGQNLQQTVQANPYSGKVTACLDQLATCGKFNLVAMTHFAAMNMHS